MSSVPMPGTEGLAHHERAEAESEAGTPPIPFTGQLTNIAPYIATAARHVCPDDVDAEEVARLAIERFSSIGALEHGDAMFHLTPEQLLDEEVAEYADAIIYRARRLAITAQRRPATRWCDLCGTSHPAEDPTCAVTIHLTPIQPPYQLLVKATRGVCPCGAGNKGDGHICNVRDQTGYSEGNRAEAPQPPTGDA